MVEGVSIMGRAEGGCTVKMPEARSLSLSGWSPEPGQVGWFSWTKLGGGATGPILVSVGMRSRSESPQELGWGPWQMPAASRLNLGQSFAGGGGEEAADRPAPQLCLPAPVDQGGNRRRVPSRMAATVASQMVAWAEVRKGGRGCALGTSESDGVGVKP